MIGQGLGRIAQAEKLSIQQLEDALENRTIPAYIGIPLLEEKIQLEQRMKMAQAGMMQPPPMTIADQVMGQAEQITGGIDQAPINFAPEMAGGGIVAFEGGGEVPRFQNQGLVDVMAQMTEDERALYQQTGQLPMRLQTLGGQPMGPTQDLGIAPPVEEETETVSLTTDQGLGGTQAARAFEPLNVEEVLEQTETLYSGLYPRGVGAKAPGDRMSYVGQTEEFFKRAGVNLDLAAQQAAEIAAEKEALGKDREEAKNMRIIEAGLAIMAGTSPNAFENIGKGATKAMQGYASDIKDLQKTERELAAASRKMMQAQNEIRMGVATAADATYQKAEERYNAALTKQEDRKADLASKLMNTSIVQQQMQSNLDKTTEDVLAMMVAEGAPDNAATRVEARREAAKIIGTTQLSAQQQREDTALAERVRKRINDPMDVRGRLYNSALRAGNDDLANRIRAEMIEEEKLALGGAGAAPTAGERVIDFGSIR